MRPSEQPLVVAYGAGVDSTAMLVEFARRGIRPDLILFADTGGEKPETYQYRAVMDSYLEAHSMTSITVVRYEPKDFKNWPPYHTLEENCLTNGTLPSLAFGFKSCSQKWKVTPQDKYVRRWPRAIAWWAAGGRVRKAIGYDAGPADLRRRNHAGTDRDRLYEYWYPLVEWGWDRERCVVEIERAGLPVPPKSSCFFCPAMKPAELLRLSREQLRRIVLMEARARPRLISIQGLWRNGTKGTRGGEAKPGSMTEYIRHMGLLDSQEIDRLARAVPDAIVSRQREFAEGIPVPSWDEFFRSIERAARSEH